MFKKLYQWLVHSSADPNKTSLSVKMALLAVVPYVLNLVTAACGLGLVCLGVDAESLNQVVKVIADIVFWALSIVSGVGFVIGFGRKLWLSLKGQNMVVASWTDER